MTEERARDVRLSRETVATALALVIGIGFYAVPFGILAKGVGMSALSVLAFCVLTYAGTAQFAAIGVIATGGSVVSACIAGAALNVRYLPLCYLAATRIRGSKPFRVAASHLMNDESITLSLTQPATALARRALLLCGGLSLFSWAIGSTAGVELGSVLPSPHKLGLDVLFPATFAVLLLPRLATARARAAAVTGAAFVLLIGPLLPNGLGVAFAGLVAALVWGWR